MFWVPLASRAVIVYCHEHPWIERTFPHKQGEQNELLHRLIYSFLHFTQLSVTRNWYETHFPPALSHQSTLDLNKYLESPQHWTALHEPWRNGILISEPSNVFSSHLLSCGVPVFSPPLDRELFSLFLPCTTSSFLLLSISKGLRLERHTPQAPLPPDRRSFEPPQLFAANALHEGFLLLPFLQPTVALLSLPCLHPPLSLRSPILLVRGTPYFSSELYVIHEQFY